MTPMPKPPSLDRSDPAVMRRAASAAKAKNTRERKLYEKRLPLFIDQRRPDWTGEDIMDQRERCQADYAEWRRGFNARQRERTRAIRDRVLALVEPSEHRHVIRRVVNMRGGDRMTRWLRMEDRIQRRHEPFTEDMDLALAWLDTWESDPPTLAELHRSCGDGMTVERLRDALCELMARDLVEFSEGRACRVSGVPWAVTWIAVKGGRADAGR